jgi:hypothetical protein
VLPGTIRIHNSEQLDSYEYLAGLIADHILASPLLDPASDDLAKALSTLPHTQRECLQPTWRKPHVILRHIINLRLVLHILLIYLVLALALVCLP